MEPEAVFHMDKEEILKNAEKFAKRELLGEASGHDWWHTYRVWKLAGFIGKAENADVFVVQLAALLHDICDYKFHNGDESIAQIKLTDWILENGGNNELSETILNILDAIKYRAKDAENYRSLTKEEQVVCDADNLDQIGAIGIARVFAYGGKIGRELYNPDISPMEINTFEDYKRSRKGTSLNFFYEKLLLVKDLIYTNKGKEIAQKRHEYMVGYVETFLKEIQEIK